MNQSIKLIEFNNCKVIPKVRIKIPSQLRTRNLITRAKVKNIIELNSVKVQASPVKNLGFSFTERRGKTCSICEIQDITASKPCEKVGKVLKKKAKNRYFNESKLKKIGFSLRHSSNIIVNGESEDISLKNIIQEIWKEPANLIEKKRRQFSLNAKMRKTLKPNTQSFNASSTVIKAPEEPNNTICIQTDFEYSEL